MTTLEARPASRRAPQTPFPNVRRPRLERLLADGARQQVTLVSAPPGAGKTTLLAAWSADQPAGSVAWYNATADGGSERPAGTTGAPGRNHADIRRWAGRHARARVLVVDDAHNVAADDLSDLVTALASAGAPDLIISSRADPAGIGRLRLEGRVTEIRAGSLAFTVPEADELLTSSGVRVSPADVVRLHDRTEGWAAGLRLMACALERGASPARLVDDDAEAQAAVSEYLLTEVLEHESAGTRRFLLHTSIAERLTPGLAALLSGEDDGGQLLSDLHRRGIFVSALDNGWYRYHSLFGALLRARLRVEDPDAAVALHRTAGRWFDDRSMRGPAEHHALAGSDWRLVATLRRARWRESIIAGDFTPPITADLPEEALAAEPFLALAAAAEDPSRPLPAGAAQQFPSETAVVTRVLACRASGRRSGVDAGTAAVAGDASADPALAPVVCALDAELRLLAGDLDGAIDAARRAAALDPAPATYADASSVEALALALHGSAPAARGVVEEVAASSAARDGRGRLGAVPALVEAVCESQRGRLSALDALDALDTRDGALPALVRIVAGAARAAASLGNGHVSMVDPDLAHDPLAGEVLVALGALEVLDATGGRTALGGPAEEDVRRARYALSTGSTRAARAAAVAALDHAGAHPRTRCEAAVLAGAAASVLGDGTGAVEHVHAALAIAARTETWAPIIEHGDALVPLISEVARASSRLQRAGIEALDLLQHDHETAVVERLTERERAVLRFLPTLMSNDEIARVMHVSVNTVKTHLKALYRKLGVSRRRDAVLRAREWDLL